MVNAMLNFIYCTISIYIYLFIVNVTLSLKYIMLINGLLHLI